LLCSLSLTTTAILSSPFSIGGTLPPNNPVKPFKNNVKIARVGKEYLQSGLAVQKVWKLDELVEFNEIEEPGVEHGFFLRFDKTHSWAAQTDADRTELLSTVFRMCQAHLRDMPLTALDFSTTPTPEESAEAAMRRNRDYELMSEAEERELIQTLGPDVVGDFDAVYARLASKLFNLETSNVQDLMSARYAVSAILAAESRSTADLLDEMSKWLGQYEVPLKNMRHYIEHTSRRRTIAWRS